VVARRTLKRKRRKEMKKYISPYFASKIEKAFWHRTLSQELAHQLRRGIKWMKKPSKYARKAGKRITLAAKDMVPDEAFNFTRPISEEGMKRLKTAARVERVGRTVGGLRRYHVAGGAIGAGGAGYLLRPRRRRRGR